MFSLNLPSVAEAMKALIALSKAKGAAPHVLSAEAERRIRALAADEPKKLGKPAVALVG